MYIQDEKQKIVGNLDITGNWDETYQASQMWTFVLILPQIGAFVTYKDKSYVILSTQTYQEDSGESYVFMPKAVITTICRILPISDEGDDISGPDNPVIDVKADELTLI